jgi:ABC-2 type transport system ATP-binding protein
MIELVNLTKKFSDLVAVNNISLEIPSGELFGFLGPNGAGKTTTIRMMAGLIKPTSGRIVIDGRDLSLYPAETKRIVGFIPDRPFLYEKLTGIEFLRFIAGLYSLKEDGLESRIHRLLELFELIECQADVIERYSHGMKQRLVMASALIHQPKVIIVDEPMVGLDPKGARLVKEIFKDLCTKGVAIFMSTHSLEVAEEMCDRIGIVQHGRVTVLGTMRELQERVGSDDRKLESIFLKLTGGEEVKDIVSALKW